MTYTFLLTHTIQRLDTTRFSTSKSQKKILNKFNRYVKGAHQSTTTANNSKANNLVQVKSLRDIIHEPEDNSQNEKKLEVGEDKFMRAYINTF